MSVKLLTKPHFEVLSLTGGCRGSSESTLVKMSNCWKSHAAAQMEADENDSGGRALNTKITHYSWAYIRSWDVHCMQCYLMSLTR